MMKKVMTLTMVAMMAVSTATYASNVTGTNEVVDNYDEFKEAVEIGCEGFEEQGFEVYEVLTNEKTYGYSVSISFLFEDKYWTMNGYFDKKGTVLMDQIYVDGKLWDMEIY